MSNSTTPLDSPACQLSPHARAFSTVLTTFIGSIVGDLSGGTFIPFMTGWISWFASLRVLIVGFWEVSQAITGRPLEHWHYFWRAIPGAIICKTDQGWDDPFFRDGAERVAPNLKGYITWTYSALWAPTIQVMWLVSNWHSASGALKIVRGLSISVAALPLTYDTKQRYSEAVARRCGRFSGLVFNAITATACFFLGVLSCVLLLKGAIDAQIKWYIYLVYCIFLLVWTHGSFEFVLPHDESHGGNTVAGLLMGAFSGCFLTAPSFTLMMMAPKEPGLNLGDYVVCQPEDAWKKLVAMFP